jgi:hypothetical protein
VSNECLKSSPHLNPVGRAAPRESCECEGFSLRPSSKETVGNEESSVGRTGAGQPHATR